MPLTPTATIGANVRAEMARSGVSQAQLGERLGLAQTSISQRLRGSIPFDVNEIHKIAGVLGVTVADLYRSVMPDEQVSV